MSVVHKGSCLCGAVRFEIAGPLPAPTACHCVNCRKVSGHVEASTDVAKSDLIVRGEQNIAWFASSEKVKRGFCKTCGSTLFFNPNFHDWMGVSMGAFDGPTGARLGLHIFVSQKGDYYDIADGLPQNDR